MNIASTISNNYLSAQALNNGAMSWLNGIGKTIKDTAVAAKPILTKIPSNNTLGLALKTAGLLALGVSAVSAGSNIYSASRNLAGSPTFDTASLDLIKAGIDTTAAGLAASVAFGNVAAMPVLATYAVSGAANQFEKIIDGTSKIYDIGALRPHLIAQADDGTMDAVGVHKPIHLSKKFIEWDNQMRKALGAPTHRLRDTSTEIYDKYQNFINQVDINTVA